MQMFILLCKNMQKLILTLHIIWHVQIFNQTVLKHNYIKIQICIYISGSVIIILYYYTWRQRRQKKNRDFTQLYTIRITRHIHVRAYNIILNLIGKRKPSTFYTVPCRRLGIRAIFSYTGSVLLFAETERKKKLVIIVTRACLRVLRDASA